MFHPAPAQTLVEVPIAKKTKLEKFCTELGAVGACFDVPLLANSFGVSAQHKQRNTLISSR